jgi:hypothetical protein
MAGLPAIPSDVIQYIEDAAKGTGLPESVVAAQNYVESGYGSNMGPSSAGAMGPWQFEPYTWPSYSNLPFSDATDWSDSTDAYIKFMSQLLKEENGNVRDALAAYNAGPGNLAAGYGYADEILSLANQSPTLTTTTSGGGTSGGTTTDEAGGILSIPSDITSFFTDANKFVNALMWIVEPGSWLRIAAFGVAIVLLLAALVVFTKADQKITAAPIPMPVPVLWLGQYSIAMPVSRQRHLLKLSSPI